LVSVCTIFPDGDSITSLSFFHSTLSFFLSSHSLCPPCPERSSFY
jgi:hypothetical protein